MLLRSKLCRILCALALGLALSACDKCGDFIWNKPASPNYCKGGPAPNS